MAGTTLNHLHRQRKQSAWWLKGSLGLIVESGRNHVEERGGDMAYTVLQKHLKACVWESKNDFMKDERG